jgi:hypothetical protein
MAKALTAEALAKKIEAQAKVVDRLAARKAKAEKVLKTIEKPLAFEQARLAHLQNTPTIEAPADAEPDGEDTPETPETDDEATGVDADQTELSFV